MLKPLRRKFPPFGAQDVLMPKVQRSAAYCQSTGKRYVLWRKHDANLVKKKQTLWDTRRTHAAQHFARFVTYYVDEVGDSSKLITANFSL
jgi:hypothetical protein